MSYSKSKSTKRFNFKINRNETSHKAGANTVIIGTNTQDSSKTEVAVNTDI